MVLVPAITPWTGRGAIGQWRRRMSIGAELAAARRRAGMNVAQVSQQTRIREPIIQAIEGDDFSACGADFYARGHIRAIAHAVGVDAEPLVQEYDDARLGTSPARTAAGTPGPFGALRARTAAGMPEPRAPAQPGPRRRQTGAVLLLVVLVAAVGLVVYHFHAAGTAHAGNAAAASGATTRHHAGHKHTAPSAAHRDAHRMVISLAAVSEPCWARLTTRRGATIFEGIISPGTSRTWTERRAVTLRLGNPGAVTLRVDGKLHPRLGPNPVTLSLVPGRAKSG